MAKKTREELIEEANSPPPEEVNSPPQDDVENPPDPPLPPELQKEAEIIMADTADAEADAAFAERVETARAAAKKLKRMLGAYSPTAPDEHILFGNGGGTFTLGDLRALASDVNT